MGRVAQIWRYPIKGIGAEPLESAALTSDRPLPGDRAWALLTGDAKDTGGWQKCNLFARGCNGPQLMAIMARTEGDVIHLSHPDAGALSVNPARDGKLLVEWLGGLWPADRPALGDLIRAPEEGMSDAPYACVSIIGTASLAALSEACGTDLDPRRFRGNLWIDGLAAWEELDWPGRRLKIGDAVLEVSERIDRCRATETNPATGERDINTLQVLRKTWGHIDFGVKARVITDGTVTLGQKAELL
ncbi:MOSC domain-containing protein [Pseudooceanicola sediminis]|uniref:MOSC domain-containing protein n=1 Tax=Pseudooceanicola sediminis TaxID=2211117 RepID=A0A399JA06_9RHOB|nr:MOSC domain-containing protein [Pseudooceanicola sediminis]KAA2314519.1 MOSC domain-containing protein [Puniceibacterium sp. HSS470]RII39486.1 MOSC domain-containing protein [Pseudooceanicola sediminis]|tara:strand:+ start:58167 stop:58901 length:735 start_codon:yes stop_codon:yes gene_type:complete